MRMIVNDGGYLEGMGKPTGLKTEMSTAVYTGLYCCAYGTLLDALLSPV